MKKVSFTPSNPKDFRAVSTEVEKQLGILESRIIRLEIDPHIQFHGEGKSDDDIQVGDTFGYRGNTFAVLSLEKGRRFKRLKEGTEDYLRLEAVSYPPISLALEPSNPLQSSPIEPPAP